MCAHADMHAERWLPLLLLYCVPGRLASGLSSGLGAGGNRRGEGRVAASARGPASGAPLWPGSVFMSVFKSTAPWGREREKERRHCYFPVCPQSVSCQWQCDRVCQHQAAFHFLVYMVFTLDAECAICRCFHPTLWFSIILLDSDLYTTMLAAELLFIKC